MEIDPPSGPVQPQKPLLRRVLGRLAVAALLVSAPIAPTLGAQEGLASYYGKRFHGKKTASGDRFNMHRMTAAHRKWRFGTRVRVTNQSNGRSVVVKVNDRGPYVHGRSIDLSYAAAHKLGMIGTGVARVRLERLEHTTLEASGLRSQWSGKPTRDELF
jgi:rare lipoprotein A (peptidoglycan hydrolase)